MDDIAVRGMGMVTGMGVLFEMGKVRAVAVLVVVLAVTSFFPLLPRNAISLEPLSPEP